jgi:acyl carrier protein
LDLGAGRHLGFRGGKAGGKADQAKEQGERKVRSAHVWSGGQGCTGPAERHQLFNGVPTGECEKLDLQGRRARVECAARSRTMAEASHTIHSEEQILALVRNEILGTGEPLAPSDNLFLAGLESMGIMRLVMKLESHHGIVVPESEITRANFSTAAALAAMVARLGGPK